ncbi:hypothetical protein BDV11DRAFT_78083 [Aspergillus similis]
MKQNDALVVPPPNRPVFGCEEGCSNAMPQHRTRHIGPPRPWTGVSQLPNDNLMFEHFQAN